MPGPCQIWYTRYSNVQYGTHAAARCSNRCMRFEVDGSTPPAGSLPACLHWRRGMRWLGCKAAADACGCGNSQPVWENGQPNMTTHVRQCCLCWWQVGFSAVPQQRMRLAAHSSVPLSEHKPVHLLCAGCCVWLAGVHGLMPPVRQ